MNQAEYAARLKQLKAVSAKRPHELNDVVDALRTEVQKFLAKLNAVPNEIGAGLQQPNPENKI